MNSNYFYDLKYVTPHGAVAYEYDKLDPYQKVDFSVFYHDDLYDAGIIDDAGLELVSKYRTVPTITPSTPDLMLEFDCESKQPASFFKLHAMDVGTQDVVDSLCDILGRSSISFPKTPPLIRLTEAGIYPARSTNKIRFMCRGTPVELKSFADSLGCANTDIITEISHFPPETTGINFDWDGVEYSSVTFHGENVKPEDPWVKQVGLHFEDRIAEIYKNMNYNVSRYTKVGLSADIREDYLKAYFIVRIIRNR